MPIQRLRSRLMGHFLVAWSRGGLTLWQLVRQLFTRGNQHKLWDQAAALSFYFLVALFPLLLALASVLGLVLASQLDTYYSLLEYLNQVMPRAAFQVFSGILSQLTAGASGGKLSLGLLATLWTASSGLAAAMDALNVAFEVSSTRSWWRHRALAIGLTLSLGLLLAASLLFLFAGAEAAAFLTNRLPVLAALSAFSNAVRWLAGLLLLWLSLALIYAFGPNLHRKRWEGILPGACFAVVCWLAASFCLRQYLAAFGGLNQSYGSLGGVIALLFWIYISAAALLLGGEINAIIWQATLRRPCA